MKTKATLMAVALVALLTFTAFQVNKPEKKVTKEEQREAAAKPGEGFASEDRPQWD